MNILVALVEMLTLAKILVTAAALFAQAVHSGSPNLSVSSSSGLPTLSNDDLPVDNDALVVRLRRALHLLDWSLPAKLPAVRIGDIEGSMGSLTLSSSKRAFLAAAVATVVDDVGVRDKCFRSLPYSPEISERLRLLLLEQSIMPASFVMFLEEYNRPPSPRLDNLSRRVTSFYNRRLPRHRIHRKRMEELRRWLCSAVGNAGNTVCESVAPHHMATAYHADRVLIGKAFAFGIDRLQLVPDALTHLSPLELLVVSMKNAVRDQALMRKQVKGKLGAILGLAHSPKDDRSPERTAALGCALVALGTEHGVDMWQTVVKSAGSNHWFRRGNKAAVERVCLEAMCQATPATPAPSQPVASSKPTCRLPLAINVFAESSEGDSLRKLLHQERSNNPQKMHDALIDAVVAVLRRFRI